MKAILNVSAATVIAQEGGGDLLYRCDTSDSGFTMTLPKANRCDGREVSFLNVGTGSNELKVDANGSETINGVTDYKSSSQYALLTVVSDGIEWYVVENPEPGIDDNFRS